MINFDPWDELLHRYVDAQGRVNYPAWQAESPHALADWLSSLGSLDPQALTRDQQLALWLNLYNALTIAQVLRMYPISSIRPVRWGVPNWIAFFRFFRQPHQLGDRAYSLNDIEHGILRPTFQDPRIHFALVCASIGCPLLRQEAYRSDSVQSQLEADAIRFINNPEKVRYDSQRDILFCSKIFQWYHQDFLKVALSSPDYIQTYLSSCSWSESVSIRYLPYDWSLNQR